MDKPRHLNSRALVALLMICSFVWLPVAGIALHFSDSAPFSPTRHLLMTIHDLAAAIFLVSVLLHLKLNWKPLMKYLKITMEQGRSYRTEFASAFLIVTVTLALGIMHVFALGAG